MLGSRLRWVCAFAFAVAAAACGSDSTTAPVDTRYQPGTNGVPVSESVACADLFQAYQSQSNALACVGTATLCPNYLRDAAGQTCPNWDTASVDGCAVYITQQTTCDDVAGALANCAVAPIGCD
ncbi:MAG TPA: hypothetical protein VGM56_33035 [Byssovorax sp.]